MNNKRNIAWCDCGTHAIAVEKDKYGDDDIVSTSISLWSLGSGTWASEKLFDKLRRAWRAFKGIPDVDNAILNQKEVEKLIDILKE